MHELFQFSLSSALAAEKRSRSEEECWERVRAVEAERGRPFGEIVHQMRLTGGAEAVPDRLGVTRHFLYTHFGWAMDKVAYVERRYGLPLGLAVAERRSQGVSMAAMAQEWGLAVTTLYGALRRSGYAGGENAMESDHRTIEA